ncbi:MAG TPA: hypothetical protein VFT54_10120, partial [Acidimicrobiia bacterium]|nr:hypothetical protein [Acidimicrobiia bacterium]
MVVVGGMVVVVVGGWVVVVVVTTVVEVVSWTVVLVVVTVGGVVAGTHDDRLTATSKCASIRIPPSSQDWVIRYANPGDGGRLAGLQASDEL